MEMKRIFLFLSLLAISASCSKEMQEGSGQSGDGVIRLFTGIEDPGTKAVATQATGVTGAAFRLIHAATEPADFSTAASLTGDIAATSGAVTFASTPNYDMVNDHNAWLIGYYPAGTVSSNAVTWDVDGKTDILRTESVWDAGKYSAPRTSGMIFNHQLSQVEVVCEAVDGAMITAVRSAWGKIKSISFVNAPAQMTFDYAALSVANGSTKANIAFFADYDGTAFQATEIPENGNTAVNARAMLAPVTKASDSKSFELEIVTEGPSSSADDDIKSVVAVKIGAGNAEDMAKGKTHKVTLTFQVDDKKIAANETTISEWVSGAEGSGSVEKPGN